MAERPALAIAYAEALEACALCEGAVGLLYLALNSDRPKAAFRELQSVDSYRGRSKLVRKKACLLYTSPSPRDQRGSRMPSFA